MALAWEMICDFSISKLFDELAAVLESEYLSEKILQKQKEIEKRSAHFLINNISCRTNVAKVIEIICDYKKNFIAIEFGSFFGFSASIVAGNHPKLLLCIELSPFFCKETIKTLAKFESLYNVIILNCGAEFFIESQHQILADFILIDANKSSNIIYIKWAVDKLLSGGIILVDNIARFRNSNLSLSQQTRAEKHGSEIMNFVSDLLSNGSFAGASILYDGDAALLLVATS